MPWDTTAPGVQSLSYFDQRLRFLKKRERILNKAYKECQRITATYAKTFYLGTSFLSKEKRLPVWAIYVWCRRTDDIVGKWGSPQLRPFQLGRAPLGREGVRGNADALPTGTDGPRAQGRREELERALQSWQERLAAVFEGNARDALDLALVDVVEKYPLLQPQPFTDMIEGMRMDLEKFRYETWDELYTYCYRVAATVGLMTLPIMGTSRPGVGAYEEAKEPAVALGIALQITNILRDVGEDRHRGRIYIPQEDMKRFNYTEDELFKGVVNKNYIELMKFEIARARHYFQQAEEGILMLAPDARLPVRASMDIYSGILNQLEENGFDNFNKRAYVPKLKKMMMLPLCWLRIQQEGAFRLLYNAIGSP
eukprot:Plantae.Rhodophyta-Purpureofilum_apyrenoidigerum.ctg10714.p1 GENE.Plantae.Rhodophyta-Purpureofilum_apyrenoidigerum.ctg10714~~Plantae.Rhodophyta-Purpureofilum_apyrenoidigerum.ctg10714.p1  ORF type:complete len:368 (-),score=57.70 Plantae.Rhodophyta-Purpureofilum_apyrenoidigerum.ctg10714:269-1372(-)